MVQLSFDRCNELYEDSYACQLSNTCHLESNWCGLIRRKKHAICLIWRSGWSWKGKKAFFTWLSLHLGSPLLFLSSLTTHASFISQGSFRRYQTPLLLVAVANPAKVSTPLLELILISSLPSWHCAASDSRPRLVYPLAPKAPLLSAKSWHSLRNLWSFFCSASQPAEVWKWNGWMCSFRSFSSIAAERNSSHPFLRQLWHELTRTDTSKPRRWQESPHKSSSCPAIERRQCRSALVSRMNALCLLPPNFLFSVVLHQHTTAT